MAPIPLILGSGRSGTTWVQDVLASGNGYRTAFEPLQPAAVVVMDSYAGQYLNAGERCDELKSFLEKVFAGKTRNVWINYRIRPDRLAVTTSMLKSPRLVYEWWRRLRRLGRHYRLYSGGRDRPVLTKFIRANLMCDWLLANFDARLLIVIRHPGAVIESKLRLGGEDWDPATTIDRYLRQADLVQDKLSCLSVIDLDKLGPHGQHALIWCIENASLLGRAESPGSNALVCFYEELVANTDQEWERVCRHLEFANIPSTESRQVASQQARPERALGTYSSGGLDKWRGRISPAAAAEIQSVLNAFDIKAYRMDSAMPLPKIV